MAAKPSITIAMINSVDFIFVFVAFSLLFPQTYLARTTQIFTLVKIVLYTLFFLKEGRCSEVFA